MSAPRSLILACEDAALASSLTRVAARAGWRALLLDNQAGVIGQVTATCDTEVAAAVVDLCVPGGGACELIAELRSRRPSLPILALTASASTKLSVAAMRAGATDCLVKPVAGDRLLQALRLATSGDARLGELQPFDQKTSASQQFNDMIGADPVFRAALASAAKAARGHQHVLVEGEIGTGKDLLLRAMQAASPRGNMPFRVIRVRAVGPNMLESVLFGHEKGAFPGAFDRHSGALEHCDGGTLGLEEVNRLPVQVQQRLAEFIASARFRPIGATHSLRVDVRIFAAANASMAEMVERDEFVPALYQELSRTCIKLPPLRERVGDIPALARHFLRRTAQEPGLPDVGLTQGALSLLCAYDWPGNVRQLQAVLFRAAVFCTGDALTAEDFPQLLHSLGSTGPRSLHQEQHEQHGVMLFTEDGHLRPLDDIETDVIRLAIGHYRGRMSEAARRLKIGRSTLYRKLAELGIE